MVLRLTVPMDLYLKRLFLILYLDERLLSFSYRCDECESRVTDRMSPVSVIYKRLSDLLISSSFSVYGKSTCVYVCDISVYE